MNELGGILREAREKQNYSLADAREELRIPERFLQALEVGEYEKLPTPIHARGYLRNYARWLKLEPQPLLDRFELEKGRPAAPVSSDTYESFSPNEPLPSRSDQPFFTPQQLELSGNDEDNGLESLPRIVIIIALLAAIGLVLSSFFIDRSNSGATVPEFNVGDAANSVVDSINGFIDPESNPTATPFPSESLADSGSSFIDTSRSGTVGDDEPTVPAVNRSPLPAPRDSLSIRLEVTQRSWVMLEIDGAQKYRGQAEAGEIIEFSGDNAARETLHIVTGNGYGIYATVNSVEIGRLGNPQEVIDEVWEAVAQ